MNMNRYKRLNLDFPYKYLKESDWWYELVEEQHHFEKLVRIEPIFGRDGWYYDRQTDTSWVETCRGCWQDKSPKMFKYYLSNYMHKRIPDKAVEAIKVLINYNICPKSLMKLMWKEQDVRKLEDTRRSTIKWRKHTIGK